MLPTAEGAPETLPTSGSIGSIADTCCRTCLEYWHDIPKGRPLTEVEFDYCVSLVDLFLDEKLPDLADEPIKVPRRSRGLPPEAEGLHP